MDGNVPVLSIVFMVVSLALAVALPVGAFLFFRFIKKADIMPFFIGCAVMILFAFVIEGAVNYMFANSSAGAKVMESILLTAVYGGIMAGIFEETGRFIAFKTVMKKKRDNDANALMYGAGHGGIEALVILGATSVNNIIWSVIINTGSAGNLTSQLPGAVSGQVGEVIRTLMSTPAFDFLLGGVERIMAMVLQISLSVLVWFAVKNRRKLYLYPVAVLIHFFVDAFTLYLSQNGMKIVYIEALLAVLTVAAALFAYGIWKKEHKKAVAEI